ncbi:MAG: ribosome silencing factor [Microcystaceae cyanobacterium]
MTPSPQVLTSLPFPPTSTEVLVSAIAAAADDRKAADLVILKVMEISYLADYFVISTGFSRAQVRAIADSIEKELEEKYQRLPTHTAGQSEGSWILQDYGDIIVHTFMPEERNYYGLESFWGHAQRLTLEELATLSAS